MNGNAGPTSGLRVLLVDDDTLVASSLADYLSAEGYRVSTGSTSSEARALLAEVAAKADEGTDQDFAVAILDVGLPGGSGLDLLREIVKAGRGTAVVMLTGYGTVETAVEALRHGAVDYLTKPAAEGELSLSLQRAVRHHTLIAENFNLKRRLESRHSLAAIAGNDARMSIVFDVVRSVAPAKTTVLMCGESGTGKSLIAHAIHDLSPRRARPFVELSCGSIPETLLESELFGHVKGAFTGAHADKIGRFKAAEGGTIFLDEINSASPAMQLKLLRVLQERKFEPVGSSQTIDADVRVVLASNQPLERLVADGHFRQDLYYRINVVKIELPPLRDRPADIMILAHRFLARFSAEAAKQVVAFAPEVEAALRSYAFPGNVRELQNLVERGVVLAKGQTITLDEMPGHLLASPYVETSEDRTSGRSSALDEPWIPMTLDEAMKEPERRVLLRALRANQWNRQKTADQLGVNRTTLYKKLKALGIEPRDEQAA
jgi:DNA-binding NtrC family response regulator